MTFELVIFEYILMVTIRRWLKVVNVEDILEEIKYEVLKVLIIVCHIAALYLGIILMNDGSFTDCFNFGRYHVYCLYKKCCKTVQTTIGATVVKGTANADFDTYVSVRYKLHL